jgi:hypothetical protein
MHILYAVMKMIGSSNSNGARVGHCGMCLLLDSYERFHALKQLESSCDNSSSGANYIVRLHTK